MGGVFIDWTGDGFIAWFETPLDREKHKTSDKVVTGAWHLSFLVNVTQLGVKSNKKFHVRHGITFEKDALITKTLNAVGHKSINIIGRAVVLAFRLAGKQSNFPSIVIQREILPSINDTTFRKWTPSRDELMKYFKGEKWGTKTLYASVEKVVTKKNNASIKTLKKKLSRTISKAEGDEPFDQHNEFLTEFVEGMQKGPTWSKLVITEQTKFLKEEMLGTLKQALNIFEKEPKST